MHDMHENIHMHTKVYHHGIITMSVSVIVGRLTCASSLELRSKGKYVRESEYAEVGGVRIPKQE